MPAFVALFLLLAPAAPADASEAQRVSDVQTPEQTQARIGLYSPRVRHSTASYLRLRLLELHEAELDRARAAIERRLSIDELLAPFPPVPVDDGRKRPGHGAAKKAPGATRRTERP